MVLKITLKSIDKASPTVNPSDKAEMKKQPLMESYKGSIVFERETSFFLSARK